MDTTPTTTTTNHHSSSHQFTARIHRAPILKTNKISTHEYSIGRWSQELGLTRYANQELPIIFGANSLEIIHHASSLRLSFCALEALRCWAYLNHPPVPFKAKNIPLSKWDYTRVLSASDFSPSPSPSPFLEKGLSKTNSPSPPVLEGLSKTQ